VIRLLGYSKQVEVIINAAVYATGNNLTIANDLTDRTLLCSLDAGCERPGARHFDFDVIEDIHSERERLVIAALTVLRAWHVAGEPQPADPMGGFERLVTAGARGTDLARKGRSVRLASHNTRT